MADYTKISELTGANLTALINAAIPSGLIMPFGNTSAPTGFVACDGSAISRTTFADLFAAIGTVWGVGDGSTTFNVPDLRGGFIRGTGSHGSENMADGNDFAGPAIGAFEDDQMQGHYHYLDDTTGAEVASLTARQESGSGFDRGSVTTGNGSVLSGPETQVRSARTDGSNGTPRTGDETRPFAAGVLYCIKT